jgi:hypothetical protein
MGHTIIRLYTNASPEIIMSDVLAMIKEESHDTSDVFHSGMLKGGDKNKYIRNRENNESFLIIR